MIAVLLSVVLAAGSIRTAPVLAAEATAEEVVSLQHEESREVQEEASDPTEDVETGSVSEEISEETADEEETVREIEEPGQNTEPSTYEAEETPEAEEEEIAEQDESSDTTGTEEPVGDNEEDTEFLADEESTAAETTETEEAAVIEEEIETAEENEALLAEDEEIDESGTCGEKATWTLKGTGRDLTLTISGSGEMNDYEDNQDHAYPWYLNKGRISRVVVEDGVTSIGNNAFCNCGALTEITIPDSVTGIEKAAFEGSMLADVYTSKGSAADLYFRSIDNGASLIFTMHYPCEQLGHKFGDWTITKDATCTEAGSKERECTRCYEIETEVIPAPGHTWAKDYTIDKEPTQTEDGSESIHCTVCDAIDKASVRVIPRLGFSVDAEFVLEKPAFNYTGNPIEPGVTVTYNGKQLVRDKDFKVTYGNNTDLGQADVDVTGIGNYTGTEHLHFTIRIGAPKKVTYTNVASGMKVSWTKVNGATRYKVYRDGKYIFTTSALEVTDKEVKYKGGTKYVYKVVATEKRFGDSEFFKTGTCYRLMPVGIKSLTNPSAGKMTVTYDKSAGCYGYVVRYGLKADMSDARVVTVQGQNTTSRTFSGMKKGKTYFVQVRTYKLDNGVRYYSGYCTTKTIKIVK